MEFHPNIARVSGLFENCYKGEIDMAIFKLIHLLSIMVWVGGMFFAYMVLRPSAAEILQPPERLQLWNRVFSLFFNWVWAASILTLLSGISMIIQFGGMAIVPHYIHAMLLLGCIMLGIFVYVFFGPYRAFSKSVGEKDWPKAAVILATIRKLVATNLLIGIAIFSIVELGRYIL
jgi:uncharacterized membrane protein